MASWPRASRPVGSRVPLRFIHLGQKGISSAGNFVHRRGVNARLHSFRRNNTIDSTAHDLVALACRCFEPRSVNLDQAPPIRSDRTRRPELAHDMASRSFDVLQATPKAPLASAAGSHRQLDRGCGATTGQAGLDRVQRIAGGHVLELREQRAGVDLDRMSDGATAVEGRMKPCWRNLQ